MREMLGVFFGPAGRVKMAWYCLRGHTVVYNAKIANGGLDLREYPRAIVHNVTVIGGDTALRLPC
jgi:hypothetical protein